MKILKNKGCLGLLGFIVLLLIISLFSKQPTMTPAPVLTVRERDSILKDSIEKVIYDSVSDVIDNAKWQCKDYVEQRLKAPSTANFVQIVGKVVLDKKDLPTDNYVVLVVVDAQNSYSAMIRSRFGCELKFLNKYQNQYNFKMIDFKYYNN